MNFYRTAIWTNGLTEPCEIIARAAGNRQRNNFRQIITVQLLDRGLQGPKALPRRFYYQQRFLCRLDFSLPPIYRANRNLKNIHARRQPLLHKRPGDSLGLPGVSACHQHDNLVRHPSPLPVRLYSSDSCAPDSCVLPARAPRYNSRL